MPHFDCTTNPISDGYITASRQLESTFRQYIGYLEQAKTAMKAMEVIDIDPRVALRAAATAMIGAVSANARAAREVAKYADNSVARKRDADRAHDLEQVALDLQSIVDRGHCTVHPEVAA